MLMLQNIVKRKSIKYKNESQTFRFYGSFTRFCYVTLQRVHKK